MQYGRTSLIRAAWLGRTITVQYLVKETSAQVNATDDVSHSIMVCFQQKQPFCSYTVAL